MDIPYKYNSSLLHSIISRLISGSMLSSISILDTSLSLPLSCADSKSVFEQNSCWLVLSSSGLLDIVPSLAMIGWFSDSFKFSVRKFTPIFFLGVYGGLQH